NGSGTPNQARDVGQALSAVGFSVVHLDNFEIGDQTAIQYAPGSEQAADLLARHLTAPAQLVPDPSLDANHVLLVTGTSFTTVMQNPRPPETTTTTTTPNTPDSTTSASAPSPTPTTEVTILPGEVTRDCTC